MAPYFYLSLVAGAHRFELGNWVVGILIGDGCFRGSHGNCVVMGAVGDMGYRGVFRL